MQLIYHAAVKQQSSSLSTPVTGSSLLLHLCPGTHQGAESASGSNCMEFGSWRGWRSPWPASAFMSCSYAVQTWLSVVNPSGWGKPSSSHHSWMPPAIPLLGVRSPPAHVRVLCPPLHKCIFCWGWCSFCLADVHPGKMKSELLVLVIIVLHEN